MGKKCVEDFGRVCVGCPTVAFRFSEKTAVEKQWTREEYALGSEVSGHGPTHFAADELGNHGNAHTDARNISSFAWAKEGMQILEDANKAGGENARNVSTRVF